MILYYPEIGVQALDLGDRDLTDVFVALAEALPKPGDIFPIADRIRWLRAIGAVADYIFRTDHPLRIEAAEEFVDWAVKVGAPAVVPAPVFHKAEAGDPTPPLANLHLRTGMVEVDWLEAERLFKEGTEAQRLQSMLLIGLRDDKFFTMGESPPARENPPEPPEALPETLVVAENPQDPPPDRIETPIEGPTKRDQLRELWARQIPVDQIAKTLGWAKATVYGTARKIGLPMRKAVMANCGCGRPASHNGRCWFRRGLSGPPGADVRARTPEPPTSLDTPETMPGAFDFAGRRVEPVPDMPTHATEVDGAIVHGDAPLTPTDRAAASEVIGAARRQLRDNGFRPPPPRPAAPERRSADQDQIDQAIAAGKMRRIPSPGEPGFSGIGELVRDPDTKKERRVATPNIDQITEILQYLRNEGDTVVGSSRDGNYTINGAAMKIDDVLARANLMRARAKKEPFRLEA